MLGLLLLEAPRAVTTERLMNLLWNEEPPAGARATMHTYVARLRALLKPHGVRMVTRDGSYAMDVDPGAIDAHRFSVAAVRAQNLRDPRERADGLAAALRLWHGPLLAHEADDLLRSRIGARLEEQRLTASELYAEAELACGRHRHLLAALAELAAQHPTRERLTGLFMLALYRDERQADALAAYQRTRRMLSSELGLEPGSDLTLLYKQIITKDPALAAQTPPRSAVTRTANPLHGGEPGAARSGNAGYPSAAGTSRRNSRW